MPGAPYSTARAPSRIVSSGVEGGKVVDPSLKSRLKDYIAVVAETILVLLLRRKKMQEPRLTDVWFCFGVARGWTVDVRFNVRGFC